MLPLGHRRIRRHEEDPMRTATHNQPEISRMPSIAGGVMVWAIMLVLAAVTVPSAFAQTFTVLYTFTNEAQGWQPEAAPILDAAGNLYGTTLFGGTAGGFGTVFELDTSGNETVLYSF